MSFFSRINKAVGALVGRKSSLGVPYISVGGAGIPAPDTPEEYLKLYGSMVWVYSSVFAISTAAASVPIKLFRTSKDKKKNKTELMEHKLLTMLHQPNRDTTWGQLIEGTLVYLELTGDAYWEVAKNAVGMPGGLFNLRPDRMKVVPSEDGKSVEGYTYTVQDKNKRKVTRFYPDEIIHFKYFNPLDDWVGQGSAKAATDTIVLEQYATRYNKAFFQNFGSPAGFLKTDQPISEEESERLERKWAQMHGGPDDSFKTPVLPFGLTYEAMGKGPHDAELLTQRKVCREEQLSSFGVPPVKVGLLENAKYANYNLQDKAFFRDTMRPRLRLIEAIINVYLIPMFGEAIVFEFDLSEYLGEDKMQQIQRIEKMISLGVMTPNEARGLLKLGDPYEAGDQFYMGTKFQVVSETTESTLDEAAQKLGYSSVAHWKTVLKKTSEEEVKPE